MKYDLSILIPSRNEEWLQRTIEDLLQNIRGNTEIIVLLDGQWSVTPLPIHERLTVLYVNKSIGQRAGTNQACRVAQGKYIMKVDAHCAFDEGFDVKMLEAFKETGDNVTMIPVMRNLHVFNWVCENGHSRYQGMSGVCTECGKETKKDVVWIPKESPRSTSYCFDTTLHFKYFGEYKKQHEGSLVESMSIQGSCFMLTREKYWELNISDEGFGSWGQQGVEVACKTWLSGGRIIVNKNTWYAHLFRTQGGDFGFPYDLSGKDVDHARNYSRKLFIENTWDKQIHPLSWLIEKFNPVPDWHFKTNNSPENRESLYEKVVENGKKFSLKKGIVYYTDNKLDDVILRTCQEHIQKSGLPIVSVSLEPLAFGTNVHLPLERGHLTMFKQILAGLEASEADIIFFCEHDVMYHPSHFNFTPSEKDTYYYNTNVWKVRVEDGHCMRVDDCRQLSGLCAYKETLIKHYKERVRRVESEGFTRKMGFEPGTHNRKERVDYLKSEKYESLLPNLDLRHAQNLTPSRWSQEEFVDKRYTKGWKEAEHVEGWDIKNILYVDVA